MPSYTLTVVITTVNDNIKRVKDVVLPQLRFVDEVVICHQIFEKNIVPEEEFTLQKLHNNLQYKYFYEKGLSKNRNHGIALATGDILYFCDDDLLFVNGFESVIKKAYADTRADLVSFQARKSNGKLFFSVPEGKYTTRSVINMFSWGITVKKKVLVEKDIRFDEGFGLGTDLPTGEENIFLRECQKKGLKMIHTNSVIVQHPDTSSGADYTNSKLILARVKVFQKMFGSIATFFLICNLTVKTYNDYHKNYSWYIYFLLHLRALFSKKV